MSLIHEVTISGGVITTISNPVAITNANLDAKLSDIKAKTDNLDVALSTRLKAADTLAKVTTVDTITNAVTLNSLPTGTNTIGKIKVTDGTYDAEVDKLGYLIGIDIDHHKVHEGERYTMSHYGTGKNDGDSINIYIKTPNSAKRIHALFSYSASGAAFGFVYEDPTVTANTGTNNQTPYNRERNSANAPTFIDNATVPNAGKYGKDTTITGTGTILVTRYSGAAKAEGADARGVHEFILKANAVYCFVVESDAAALTLQGEVEVYEV